MVLFDDIVYVGLLIVSIGFGHYYRQIEDVAKKQLVGVTLGCLIVFAVSGFHIIHPIISTLVGALIVIYVNKRICHLVSFVFMFGYLLFFRYTHCFGIPTPPNHTNLIQMVLTLKLVGMAFEANSASAKRKAVASAQGDETTQPLLLASEENVLRINVADVYCYAFNYIGVLTGPYFTYRTYNDFLHLPFNRNADCMSATINKMKWTPMFAGLFLVVSHYWPLSYAMSPEFYEERSIFYRLMYVWPTFFIFRMRLYTGLTLSECVCSMAGLGAYPVECESTPGGGPAKEYLHLTKKADKLQYDFRTINNVDVFITESCFTFREAMKSWNMCIQYWLAVYIYKRFPNKKFRTFATMLVSAFWHGVYPGYYFCIFAAPFYLPVEDVWNTLVRRDAVGNTRRVLDCVFWVAKFYAFSYMGTAFLMMYMDKIWLFYSSVYHLPYIMWIAMYALGVLLLKQKKAADRKKDK